MTQKARKEIRTEEQILDDDGWALAGVGLGTFCIIASVFFWSYNNGWAFLPIGIVCFICAAILSLPEYEKKSGLVEQMQV